MLPISVLLADFFWAGALFLLDAAFRPRLPDIFIPGISILGILPIWCFLVACLLLAGFLFFRDVELDFDFPLGLLIPGIFDISCWARTGTVAATSRTENRSAQTLTRNISL
jgi:hypothetical protein